MTEKTADLTVSIATPAFREWMRHVAKLGGRKRTMKKRLASAKNGLMPVKPGSAPRGRPPGMKSGEGKGQKKVESGPRVTCICGNVWRVPAAAETELVRRRSLLWTCGVCSRVTRVLAFDLIR